MVSSILEKQPAAITSDSLTAIARENGDALTGDALKQVAETNPEAITSDSLAVVAANNAGAFDSETLANIDKTNPDALTNLPDDDKQKVVEAAVGADKVGDIVADPTAVPKSEAMKPATQEETNTPDNSSQAGSVAVSGGNIDFGHANLGTTKLQPHHRPSRCRGQYQNLGLWPWWQCLGKQRMVNINSNQR